MQKTVRALLRHLAVLFTLLLAVGIAPAQADTARRKVIVDQDSFGPGSTNLQSILLLLQAPDVDVLGITVTSGDGWRDEEVAHVLRLLEVAHRPDVPVYAGAVYPLVNSASRTNAWEQRHGRLVYKGAWSEPAPAGAPSPQPVRHADPFEVPPMLAGAPTLKPAAGSAAEFLVRSVRQYPGQVTVWAGGPLTNVALAARLDPRFAALAKELVFMGGSFNPVAADNAFAAEYLHSPRREFNMRWDPEAASLVLHEPWPRITQLPIDPTTKTLFRKDLFAEIAAGNAPFASYVAAHGQQFPMWDELAAAVWIDPTLVTRRSRLLVDIDTADGPGYGDTLSWPIGQGPRLGEREVEVVMGVDVARFERWVVKLLSASREPER